jgi:A/G-specific adenine glycosylase
MLQQTRVLQGTPYYLKFVANFPTVQDLANASEERILKLWQGLGYYSRARNLHATAKMVVNDYDGKFPDEYKELLKLKGVGDYTASAIASICFDEPEPVVDGNVYRVLARYYGIDTPINSTQGIKYFKSLARKVMDADNIRDYNQGIMEFGAMQCTPKKPNCEECPLSQSCVALKDTSIDRLPVKINKTKVRIRHFNYLVPIIEAANGINKTLLRQRLGKGIWQNLFEFPLLEVEEKIDLRAIKLGLSDVIDIKDTPEIFVYNDKVIIHKLSHQHLHTTFWIIKTTTNINGAIPLSEIQNFAVPVLIADFIKTSKNLYF